MYRSLLVPLDGSLFAEHALALALSIAKRAEAEVKLVYVRNPLEADYHEAHLLTEQPWTTELKTRHRAYLDDIAQRLQGGGAKITAPAILQGDISSTICRYVIDSQIDLVTHALNRSTVTGAGRARELPNVRRRIAAAARDLMDQGMRDFLSEAGNLTPARSVSHGDGKDHRLLLGGLRLPNVDEDEKGEVGELIRSHWGWVVPTGEASHSPH